MRNKITLQTFSECFSEKIGISKNASEIFVRSFFSVIREALINENLVKIKGLGTFKLVMVNSRESINVNTGERFEIGEHTKIMFTPEKLMKQKINAPFECFSSVEIEEEDIEKLDIEEETDNTDSVSRITKYKAIKEENTEAEAKIEVEEKSETVESTSSNLYSRSSDADEIVNSVESQTIKRNNTSILKVVMIIVIVLLLLFGVFILGCLTGDAIKSELFRLFL